MKRQAILGLMLISLVLGAGVEAKAERRHVGIHDANGNPFLVDVDVNHGAVTQLPAGHLPDASIVFVPATRQRLNLPANATRQDADKIIQKKFLKASAKVQKLKLMSSIKRISRLYNVDPAAVLAAIMGELTFNNDFGSAAQEIAATAMPSFMNFRGAARVSTMLSLAALRSCDMERSDYWSWVCANRVWSTSIGRARGAANTSHLPAHAFLDLKASEETLHAVLRPSTGTSYGLGQISLVQVLMLSADVSEKTNLPRITIDRMSEGLALLKTHSGTIHIIAAGLRRSIDVYRRFAGFDISANIGVQATLFNLGYDFEKAFQLHATNKSRQKAGQPIVAPRENYFGYYMNEFEPQLRAMLAQGA